MARIAIKNYSKIINSIPLLNEEIGRITSSAVNATAKFISEIAVNKITEGTGLSQESVEKRIRIEKASESKQGKTGVETASVIPSKARVPIISYTPSYIGAGHQTGVQADISLTKPIYTVPRGFTHDKRRLWQRKGEKAYPISIQFGPSVAHHFNNITDELIKAGEEDLAKRFQTRIENALKRLR